MQINFRADTERRKKGWMTGALFEEWVRKLDSSFLAQSRKVALLIENCPAHPEIMNLTPT